MKNAITIFIFTTLISIANSAIAQDVVPPATVMTNTEFKSFLLMFMDYPEKSLDHNEAGKVIIEFTTDATGLVSERNVTKGVSPEIDSTALVIFDYLLWNPARENNKEIDSKNTFEIEFNKKKFLRLAKKRGYLHLPSNYAPIDSTGILFALKKVQIAPRFQIGDNRSLPDFLYNNLIFPEIAAKLGITGTVKLTFVIERNGMPSNIAVAESIGGGCTEEAIRLVELTRWIPGMVNSKYVRTYYEIIIHFKKGEKRDNHIPNQSNSGL
ncbi:MAG: energy transducer TonB [Bacteroidales bacterium]|jgi:TonB family protein